MKFLSLQQTVDTVSMPVALMISCLMAQSSPNPVL